MRAGTDAIVDDALSVRGGEQLTAVVRLSEPSQSVASQPEPVRQLQDNAARAQQAVTEFARQRDDMRINSRFWITNAVVVTLDTAQTPLADIAALSGVERIHENFELVAIGDKPSGADGLTTLSHGAHTYGLEQIDVPQVWAEFGTQGEDASVVVLDTGIDASHPDLDLTEWAEFDSEGNQVDSDPFDNNGHGTHVSGTVAGGDASGDHIGVAPGADLYHAGVLTEAGGTFSSVIAGIEWAVAEEADVVNMSLGPEDGGYIPELIAPLQNATAAGTLPVSACGNGGSGSSGSPANVYGAGLAVGATDSTESITLFSGGELIDTDEVWGGEAPAEWPPEYIVPDVVAPGDGVKSSVPGGGYATANGTSMASPHVAGVAALIAAASGGDATPGEVREALETTAEKPEDWDPSKVQSIDGKDTRYGEGIVDSLAAVADVLEEPIVIPSATYEDGTVQLSLNCAAVSELVVEDLWVDWKVSTVTPESDFTDHIDTEGRCSWKWGDARSLTPSLTLDVPVEYVGFRPTDYPGGPGTRREVAGYVGGSFEMSVRGTAFGKATETTVAFDVEYPKG